MEQEQPANREETGRNPDGTFKPGFSGNPEGRPKDTLKEYIAKKLRDMSEEEKEEFLKGIPKETQWKMGEGNPSNELSGKDGKELIIKVVSFQEGNGDSDTPQL
jgi:hypothetical protein